MKEINTELERQHELVKKLNDDKSKDNEESLAYDSEYKWTTDYIRLDYVDKIHEVSSNIWNNVADEEDKLEKSDDRVDDFCKQILMNRILARMCRIVIRIIVFKICRNSSRGELFIHRFGYKILSYCKGRNAYEHTDNSEVTAHHYDRNKNTEP